MPLSNFTRPSIPYANAPLPNDNRFNIITRVLKKPITTDQLDGEFNKLTDNCNILDNKIEDVVAGNIPGSDEPLNAGKFLTTDGHSNLSFVNVTNDNIEEGSISGNKITPLTIGTNQLDNGIITPDKIPNNSIPYSKMDFNEEDIPYAIINVADGAIPGPKISGKSITQAQQGLLSVGTPELIDDSVTLNKLAGPIDVIHGGTGLDTLVTPYGVVCAGTTPTGNIQNAGVGTLNQIFMGNGNVALASWKNLNTLAASKADQINGNSNSVYVSPSTQQDHLSSPKAWVRFQGSNGNIFSSYGVSAVLRNSTGNYTITFTNAFTDLNYFCIPNAEHFVGIGSAAIVNRDNSTFSTTQSRVQAYRLSDAQPIDPAAVCVFFFGNQS